MKQLSLAFVAVLIVQFTIAQTTGTFTRNVNIGGSVTSVDYYVPTTYTSSKEYKVIVNLEKASQGHYTAYADTADGIVIGTGLGNYQDIAELVDSTENWYNLDTNNIYLTGFSARGYTCLQVGLQNHGYFKGLIPLAPNSAAGLAYPNGQFIPTCIVTGTSDGFANTTDLIYGLLQAQSGLVDSSWAIGIGHVPTGPDIRTPMIAECFNFINQNQPPGVGIVETTADASVILSPNPTKDRLKIELRGKVSDADVISIFDATGKYVYLEHNAGTTVEVDVSKWAKGSYVLRYSVGGTIGTRKFVVN